MTKHLRDVADDEAPKLLLLLSREGISSGRRTTNSKDRVFECKTCNKAFPTFQALGGHRTGHKRSLEEDADSTPAAKKPAAHQCAICGLVFQLGQALGGHMRRHKDVIGANSKSITKYDKEDVVAAPAAAADSSASELLSSCTDAHDDDAVVGHLVTSGAAGNSHSGPLGDPYFNVDLELRLGLAPAPTLRIATVYDEPSYTALRLGIQA